LVYSQSADPANQKNYSAEEVTAKWRETGFRFKAGWKPVTDPKTAEEFGVKFAKAFQEKDRETIDGMLTFSPLVDKGVKGLGTESYRDAVKRDLKKIEGDFVGALSAGTVTFSQTKDSEFGPVALTRVVNGDGSINFEEWRLMESPKEDVKAVDVFIYSTGESLSDTGRRLWEMNVPTDNRSFFGKMMGTESAYVKKQKKLLAFLQAKAAGKWNEAYEIYESLDPEMANQKGIMLNYLKVASKLEDEKYQQALEEYEKLFPNDSAQKLMSMSPTVSAINSELYGRKIQIGRCRC